MKEVYARIIHERTLLMCKAEAEVLCQCPNLGDDIYRAWTEQMDVTAPVDKYGADAQLVTNLIESIRLIILDYDALIDRV